MAGNGARLKLATMIVLGVVAVVAIAAITVTAVLTSRDLVIAEAFVSALVLLIAVLGGLTIWRGE